MTCVLEDCDNLAATPLRKFEGLCEAHYWKHVYAYDVVLAPNERIKPDAPVRLTPCLYAPTQGWSILCFFGPVDEPR